MPRHRRRRISWVLRAPSPTPPEGLRPVNVIIWAMKRLNPERGVNMRKIKSLIKANFVLPCEGRLVDTRVRAAVRLAMDFGILKKERTLYFFKRSWLRKVDVGDETKVDRIINEVSNAIRQSRR